MVDNGLVDLDKDFDPELFKQIENQVIIRFTETNKEQFTVDESVKL